MYFGQILDDVSIQYAFVKKPNDLINLLYFRENADEDYDEEDYYFPFPDLKEAQLQFKNTQVYKTLKYNKNDSEEIAQLKQDYTKAYVELLNAIGLAIIAKIIHGVDYICQHEKAPDLNGQLYKYFCNENYMDELEGLISYPEHPIDHVSFLIGTCNLNKKGIEELNNIRDFYLEAVENIQQSLKEINDMDFFKVEGFNYDKVDEWILPFYVDIYKQMDTKGNESVDIKEIIDEDENTVNNSKLSDEQIQKIKSLKPKSKKDTKSNRVIISIEEAINKNFAELVGLKDVKSAILRKTKLIKKIPNKLVDCNFRLTGNPGVGKTTVAEAMSKAFYDAGIIKSNNFVQLNGAGLKGKYVGHTVPKVQEIFEKAKGGTLFLDEVYSLVTSEDADGDTFAQEAITELMIQVEKLYNEQKANPDAKTLIILAGYKDKVNDLLDKNVGFKRRFPNVIDIKDYSIEELHEIFKMYVEKDGFTTTEDADKKIDDVLDKERKKKNFSNAGYVRNLVQAVEESQAVRADEKDFVIKAEDVIDAEKNLNEDVVEKIPLGFH